MGPIQPVTNATRRIDFRFTSVATRITTLTQLKTGFVRDLFFTLRLKPRDKARPFDIEELQKCSWNRRVPQELEPTY